MDKKSINVRYNVISYLTAGMILMSFSLYPTPVHAWVYYQGAGGRGGPSPMDLHLEAH